MPQTGGCVREVVRIIASYTTFNIDGKLALDEVIVCAVRLGS